MIEQAVEIDAQRARGIVDLLGAERVHAFVDVLRERLDRLVALAEAFPDGAETLVAIAHQSQGSAGSIGLPGLAAALLDLEAAAKSGDRQAVEASMIAAQARFALDCRLLAEAIGTGSAG